MSGVELSLSEPANVDMEWVGNESLINELKAAWMIVDKDDLPLLSVVEVENDLHRAARIECRPYPAGKA